MKGKAMNDKQIAEAVDAYVNFRDKSDLTVMEKFYSVGSIIRAAYPEASVRDIAKKFARKGFEKSNIQLLLALIRDFPKAPKMSIHAYSRHSGMLAKVDVDKRLETAERLQKASKSDLEGIYSDFGLSYKKTPKPKTDDVERGNPDDAKITRERLQVLAKLCVRDNMQAVACEVFGAVFGYDVVLTAVESAKNAIKEKQAAARKLRKKAA